MKRDYFNLQIDVLEERAFFDELFERLKAGDRGLRVNFLNAHCFNVAHENASYRDALNESTYLLNDGIGVDLGAKRLGFRFPDNLNGTDLIPKICERLAEQSLSVFLLGAKPHVVKRVSQLLTLKNPGLQVVGYSAGYFDSNEQLLKQIESCHPDAVIVAMGVPRQELWVQENYHKLPQVGLFVCGGAIFDFLAGEVKRAPQIFQKFKLEWAFRLMQEPRRLFKRYMIGNFVFLYRILVGR